MDRRGVADIGRIVWIRARPVASRFDSNPRGISGIESGVLSGRLRAGRLPRCDREGFRH